MNLRMTRRQMLGQSALGLLAAGLWPGRLSARDTAGDFHFIAVNDLHYLNDRCNPWFEKVVKQIAGHREKIEFCLVVGDLVHNGKPEEFAPIRDYLKKLPMPFHVVIGNHDYRTQEDRKPYEATFPDRINYRFDHGGWQFLGIDSSDGQKYKDVAASKTTLQWLDDTLPKLDKKKPTVLFTHFPLGPLVPSRLTNAEDVMARFKEFNLQAVFDGHFHGFTERKIGTTILTTNKCCAFSVNNHDGTKEKGYFLCRAKDGTIERQFVEVKPA